MESEEAMSWRKDLSPYLPQEVRERLDLLEDARAERVTELCLRAGQPAYLKEGGEHKRLSDTPLRMETLRQVVSVLLQYTPASRREERSGGYICLPGGYRAGLCGITGWEEGEKRVREVTSVMIRIHRRIEGCSLPLLTRICRDGTPMHTLVVSAPGMGKTTLLADAARQLSRGVKGGRPCKVCVVDERGEFSGGMPTEALGPMTDVLCGVEKAAGAIWLVRSMAPEVLILDEIGSRADVDAVKDAVTCGVSVLVSAHAGSLFEAKRRPLLAPLFTEGWIDCAACLGGSPGRVAALEIYP